MELPGRVGYGIIGDDSLEFYRDPLAFMEKKMRLYGRVFSCRFLNKPTVFLTSNSSVRELLNDKCDSVSAGYKEFMFELFDENLVFMEGDSWQGTRDVLCGIFDHNNLPQSLDTCNRLVSTFIEELPLSRQPVVAYEHLKSLTTRLTVALFLDNTVTDAEMQQVSDLMTQHWHGIISVPVNFKVPLLTWRSGYGKALAAKRKLLDIIKNKLQSGPSEIASAMQDSDMDIDVATHNILLFISALIPKALAALMTSILVELAKPEHARYLDHRDDASLDDIILECQRLWPPFIGGRRICTKAVEISGYAVPEGHSILYTSYLANRDGDVFKDPDVFKPERWKEDNIDDRDLVWTFGGGARTCIGKVFTAVILRNWLREMMASLKWNVTEGHVVKYKMLPVLRPNDDLPMTFQECSRSDISQHTDDTSDHDTDICQHTGDTNQHR